MTEAELSESFRRRRQKSRAPDPPAKPVVLDAVSREELAQVDEIDHAVGVSAARAVAMRMLGFDTQEIADEMHVDRGKVERWLFLARKKGALSDVGDRLEYYAVALATDKLIKAIEAGDKDAILETLKGRGLFRSFSQTKNDTPHEGAMNLQVVVELPTGVRSVADIPVTGQIVGSRRELSDGEETEPGESERNAP